MLHALECAARIERSTIAGEAEVLRNELIQGAVLHNLQIIAQSIMPLPDELRDQRRTSRFEVRYAWGQPNPSKYKLARAVNTDQRDRTGS